jgi:hypothetical protein
MFLVAYPKEKLLETAGVKLTPTSNFTMNPGPGQFDDAVLVGVDVSSVERGETGDESAAISLEDSCVCPS